MSDFFSSVFGSSSSRKESPKESCHYSVLGVRRNASAEEVRTAYRRLALKYHPDRLGNGDGEEKMKAINKAYDILSDPVKRDRYDRGEREPSDSGDFGRGMRPYSQSSTVHVPKNEPVHGGYQNVESVLAGSGLGNLFEPMRQAMTMAIGSIRVDPIDHAVLHSTMDGELDTCGLGFISDAFWKAVEEKFRCHGCGRRMDSLNELCYCRKVAKVRCHCLNVCCTKADGK